MYWKPVLIQKALYDVIGFKPETSVKEGGVKNFVEWYRNFYKV